MPAGLLPAEGIGEQLEYILKRPISGVLGWSLWLWVNDLTPVVGTVLADLVEASFGGYFRGTLDRASWTTPVVTGGCAKSTWGTVPTQWTVSGPPYQTIHGWALVDEMAGVIRFVQRFDPEDIIELELGDKVKLLPEYTLTSAEC